MTESVRSFATRFWALFRRRTFDRDLDAELPSHLDMAVERNLRNGMALAGELLGSFVALAVTRLMATMLFGVTAADPMTFAGVAVLLTAVACAACHISARRATRIDPMVALSCE